MSGYWADHSSDDLRRLAVDSIAVLPLGATEQHGPHLPLGVDTDLTDAVIRAHFPHLDESQSILVLPTLSITKSDEHAEFAGTLSLSAETLLAVLRDIGDSVARAGIRRLVFFSGHGGNAAVLSIAARDLRRRHRMIVASCGWSAFADWRDHVGEDDYAHDVHAGLCETSAMRAVRPDLVDMSLAADFRTRSRDWEAESNWIGLTGQPGTPAWLVQDLNPHGACGNAALATAELGRALIESSSRNFARFLRDFARFDPAEPGS